MKKPYQWMIVTCSMACLLFTGCQKKSNGVWDDSNTADRYKSKNGKSLWGNDADGSLADSGLLGPSDEDFIPLSDEDLKSQFADSAIPQPQNTPGDVGSGLPGLDQFKDPSSQLAAIFRTLYFNTDDHVLRGKESISAIDTIASYLKDHPHTYIFIEGYCDERGAEAYNLSLGARRANYIRAQLIKKGVDLNQIHTVSYGKEKPAVQGHSADVWAKNRRAEFKIFQKS